MPKKAAKTTGPAAVPARPAQPAQPASSPIIEEVRQLVRLMVEHDLGEVDVTDGDRKITLKRGSGAAPTAAAGGAGAAPIAPAAGGVPALPAARPAAGEPAREEAPPEHLAEIRSPMVGTFYAAASPDSEPYVREGSAVGDETVVAIIEAMKVMNEIRAECSGAIADVCVQNAQPVEYGQVLFRVRPG